MPWDNSRASGFTSGTPWLPLNDDHATINVAALEQDQSSILHLYRKLIDLRRSRRTLVSGKLRSVTAEKGVLRYQRIGQKDRILIVLNLGIDTAQIEFEGGTVLASTRAERVGKAVNGFTDLASGEGLVIDLA